MRLVIVADNVSMRMGGEASLPFYYFKLLHARQFDVWVVCHERVRSELQTTLSAEELRKIRFVEDTALQKVIWKISQWFPYRVKDLIFGQLLHFLTQLTVRKRARQLIQGRDLQLVFQPAPITPKGVSLMYNMGIPTVIGPLCGGLELPPAFQYMDSRLTRISIRGGRMLSNFMNRLFPGKLQADALIVANPLTAQALPNGYQGRLYEVIESGVDLSLWQPKPYQEPDPNQPVRFVYAGRFVDWKGVQFLVEAFGKVAHQMNAVLELIGDGELRGELEDQVKALGICDRVIFHGWMAREKSAQIVRDCDVFVMPSLRECGGTAILEAMAMGLPTIVTNWAGPAEYVDASCGILVDPSSQTAFVDGFAEAMLRLAASPELRRQMGEAGTVQVTQRYLDWNAKVDRVIEIFRETVQSEASTASRSVRTHLA